MSQSTLPPTEPSRHNRPLLPGAEKMVLTPGGYKPAAQVHQVDEGHHLLAQDGRILLVKTAKQKAVKDLGLSPNGAPSLLSRLVRQMSAKNCPDETPIRNLLPQLGNGWVAYAEWLKLGGEPLSLFTAEWEVPPPPTNKSDQTIFLFVGLQNTHFIMQPVLQWGVSAAGGGKSWSIANWYVGSDGSATCHTKLKEVKQGEILSARIELVEQKDRSFTYRSSFDGLPALDLVKKDVIELFMANVVLETYHVKASEEYPATPQTPMTKLKLFTGSAANRQLVQPNWSLMPTQPISNRPHTVMNSGNDTIFLNYGLAPASSAILGPPLSTHGSKTGDRSAA